MTSSSWMTQNRVPKGSPEAGEWSEGRKGEAEGVSLSAGVDAPQAEGFYGEIKDADQRVERMKEDLHNSVMAIAHGPQMMAYLDATRQNRARQWSMSNRILAASQLAEREGDPSLDNVIHHLMTMDCGSFKQWKERGRAPVKGSKALYILAPVTRSYTRLNSETGEEETKRYMVGVKPMATFDVSQTDGDPVPQRPAPKEFTATVRPGTVEAIKGRYEELGYAFSEKEIEGTDPATLSGTLAYVRVDPNNPDDKQVVVDSRLSETQKSAALAHELGHIELGHTDESEDRDYSNRLHRGEMETEAEAFSYMMMRDAGATVEESEAFSPNYIAGWSKGDSKVITKALDNAAKAFFKSRDAMNLPE